MPCRAGANVANRIWGIWGITVLSLFVVDGLALLAGISVGYRAYPRDYVSFATTAILVAMTIVCVPVHVAGWFDVLHAPVVLAASVFLACAVLVVFARLGVDLRAACRRFVVRPFGIVAEAWRDRSVAVLALVATYVVLAYAVWACWLAPTCSWDGLGYQEAIIGYAIQEHGFREVLVRPEPFFQQINTMPKGSSYLGIHYSLLLGDARLVELPSTVLSPLFLLAGYKLMRRHCSRWLAVCLAVGAFLVPGYLLQLRSTYVDSMYASLLAVGLAFLSVRELRGRDVVVASAAIGWAASFKVSGFFFAPALMVLLLWRVRGRGRRVWLSAGLGIVFAISVGSASYARNISQHDNPVWPYRIPHVDALGIDIPSPLPEPSEAHSGTMRSLWGHLYSAPKPKRQFADTRDNGYGNGPPVVIFPLALLALLVMCGRALRALRRRRLPDPEDRLLWLYAAPGVSFLLAIPVLEWARYSLFSVLVTFVLAGWMIERGQSVSWREALAGIVVVTGLMTFGWSDPGWGVKFDVAREMAAMSTDERYVHQLRETFQMSEAPARAREELRPGEVFAYSASRFPGSLWNRHYTNRVEYIPQGNHGAVFARLRPAMIVAVRNDYLHKLAVEADYEDVGPTTRLGADERYRVLRAPLPHASLRAASNAR